MRYWLMKTEPTTFGVEDLAAAPRHTTGWDGVRNYQARNMLRDEMRRGDQAFLYYSSCEVPGVAAIMQIAKAGYPDPTAFDRKNHHYDPDSDPKNPRWFMVDVQLKRRLARVITLEELRAHAGRELKGMVLLRPGNRLSVTPVEAAHWKFILSLE
jgi:predicted RNA-binding protein with PUA-like domain